MDTAIRRRFHLKARLNTLTRQQRADVMVKFAMELNCKLPKNIRNHSDHLDGLAFGHVMNAAEVARYQDQVGWRQFMQLIRSELAGTEGEVARSIGFVRGGGSYER